MVFDTVIHKLFARNPSERVDLYLAAGTRGAAEGEPVP